VRAGRPRPPCAPSPFHRPSALSAFPPSALCDLRVLCGECLPAARLKSSGCAPMISDETLAPGLWCLWRKDRMVNERRIYLSPSEMPTQWYNIAADMPWEIPPYIDPDTHRPIGPEALAAIFPPPAPGTPES